jgi:hypothetical protein
MLLTLLAVIGGAVVLLMLMSRFAVKEGFQLSDLWQPVCDFFEKPAAFIVQCLRFVRTATLWLMGALLASVFGLAICGSQGWSTLAHIFYGIGAACVISIAVLWRPFYLATDAVLKSVPALVERIQTEVRWVMGLVFWSCIPLVASALIPRGASLGAVMTVLSLGALLVLGAANGYWTLPAFISMKLLQQKLEVLFVVALIGLYVPSFSSYLGWIGAKVSEPIMPERRRVADEVLAAETNWFTANGRGRYYACQDSSGEFRVFTVPGRSPETNQELEEVASTDLIAEIKQQAKGRIDSAAREKEVLAVESALREDQRRKAEQAEIQKQTKLAMETQRKLDEEKKARDKAEQERMAVETAAREREKKMQETEAQRQELARLVARYNALPAGSNSADQAEVAVVFLREAASDLRDRVLQPAFVALTANHKTFLPAAMNAEALNDDGELQRLWNGDVQHAAAFGFEQRVDYLMLVGAQEETTASKVQASLSSLRCTVIMKLYSTNPLRLIKTLDVSTISPGLSRDSMLAAAKKRLEEELGKAVPNLF